MSGRTRILLINDNSAHSNWGAQASPPSLLDVLAEALPGSSATALSHSWLTRQYRRMAGVLGGGIVSSRSLGLLRPIVYRCSTPVSFFPDVADDFDFWANEWEAGRGGPHAAEFLRIAANADVVVYNGENSIYRNTPEGCHGIFLVWYATTRMRKPGCIVNHTAQLDGVLPIMASMVKLAYPALDLVAVREPRSLENLKRLGIANAELFPDVVFAQHPEGRSSQRVTDWRRRQGLSDQSYFCLSASGLPVSTPRGSWDGEVTALVRDLKASGLQAVLVAKDPWCLFLEEVAERTGSLFFGPDHEYQDLWPLFEGASFLVTGHYHYAIFASMVGCPFIPLSANNHKMQGLCEHLGWERTMPFDATWLRSCRSEIVEEASQLRKRRETLGAHLKARSSELRVEARRLGSRVADVVRTAHARGVAAGRPQS